MADQTISGTLSVTEKVGIRIDNPSAQLHIASPAGDPSEALIESSGVSLKLSVNATGASIGTTNAFPLSILTGGSAQITITPAGNVTVAGPLTAQSALTVAGNVSIGTDTTPATLEVKGNIQGGGATLTGPLTIQNVLTISGNVGIGTVDPQAKLDVRGGIHAGNSDIYFTKNDHNHTGIGNTPGFAAIENAVDFDALMILGRAGTAKGRSVKLWDYLQVNGDLEVTGNILGRVAGIGFASAPSLTHGQSIPVPAGFSRQECVFLAAVKFLNFRVGEAVLVSCSVDGNGKVSATPDGKVAVTAFALAKKGGW